MSYIDPRTGEWKAGLPPGVSLAEAQARVARARHGDRLELAEGPSSIHAVPEELTGTLADAQQRRRERVAEERAAWLTEAETCKALRLDASELYGDLGLLAACKAHEGELLFDAQVIAERATRSDAPATAKADLLLEELREHGLDLGGAA